MSSKRVIISVALLAVVIGGVTALATAMGRPHAPQNREFFLFAQDLHFGDSQAANGLSTDYVYSANVFVVNKGDTVTIHFYNPTDQAHSFTMNSPYSNDAVVQPATSSSISKADIVFTVSSGGIFLFHCKFHPPQMTGSLVVQS